MRTKSHFCFVLFSFGVAWRGVAFLACLGRGGGEEGGGIARHKNGRVVLTKVFDLKNIPNVLLLP
jgi:hypothetical protein